MKIVQEFLDVVEGGFEWVGLQVVERNDTVWIRSGRIGRAENPLITSAGGQVTGGWVFEEKEVTLLETDRSVDILHNIENDELYLLIRSFDEDEIYPAEIYENFLTILNRDGPDLPWKTYRPVYRNLENG